MSYLRDGIIPLACGLLAVSSVAVSSTAADEYIATGQIDRIDAHCTQYGQGFIDLGNGLCGRVSRHTRVYVGANRIESPAEQRLGGWATNGTSSAALRSDGMVPGADATHLRVRGGLDTISPFR